MKVKQSPANIFRQSVFRQSVFRQAGLSLVELLVALVIGLFLVGGMITVMSNSKSQFLMEQELAVIQENARYVMDELAYDIRMAGYYGCDSAGSITNTIDDSTTVANWFVNGRPVFGYNEGVTISSFLPVGFTDIRDEDSNNLTDSDILFLSRGIVQDNVYINSHDPSSSVRRFYVTTAQEFYRGDVVAISSDTCDQISIFQMRNARALPTDSSPSIRHGGGTSRITPGNCVHQLSGFENCLDSSGATSYDYGPGSQLMRFTARAYYVGVSDISEQPTLYRAVLQRSDTTATAVAEEVVPGVDDFQITYGVDLDTDGIPNRYFNAAAVPEWGDVIAVRIDLIFRSTVQLFPVDVDPINPDFDLGDGFEYDDGFLRQRVSSTINIRNRSF